MKHIFRPIPWILLTLCLLSGCNRTSLPSSGLSPSEPSAPVSSEIPSESSMLPEITIAGVVFNDDDFMQMLIKGYKDAAENAGVTLTLDNCAGDLDKESDLIDTYISQQFDGIAIAPLNSYDSYEVLNKAYNTGIQIAVTHTSTGEDADFLAGGYYADDKMNGIQVGEAAVAFIREQGWTEPIKMACINFEMALAEPSRSRQTGFFSALDNQGIDYEIVAQQTDHIADSAYVIMNAILAAHPEVQIVFCCNEGATVGATRAVAESANKGKTFVFGYDGSDDTTNMLLSDDNVLQAVVSQDPYTMGYKAVEQLVKVIRGEAQPTGKCEVVPGILLSRTDPEGVKKWRQSYGLS